MASGVVPGWIERLAVPLIVGVASSYGTLKLLDYRVDQIETTTKLQGARIDILQATWLETVNEMKDKQGDSNERLARIEGYLERMERSQAAATKAHAMIP